MVLRPTWTSIPNGLIECLRDGSDCGAEPALQLGRIARGDPWHPQLRYEQETVGRSGGAEVLLPCESEVRQHRSEGHVITHNAGAHRPRTLVYRIMRIYERPVVG